MPGSTTITTAPSTAPSSTTSNYLLAPFVISGSITVPAQTSIESGTFSTTTLSDHTGPPGSYSATTTTGSDHRPTILPIWFNFGGFPVIVFPINIIGPPGIIPPPPGFPALDIGPDGEPTPDPNQNNQNPSNSASDPATQTTTQTNPTSKIRSTSSISSSTPTSASTPSTSASSSTSTSTPTASATPYLIVPKDTANQNDKQSFQSTLAQQVGESNIQSADDGTGEAFWKAPLNTTQVRDFSSNPIISFVAPDTTLTVDDMVDPPDPSQNNNVSSRSFTPFVHHRGSFPRKKRAPPTTQPNAPEELAVVSQPKNQLVPMIPSEYQYDPSGGKGITVYVVDSGAGTQNPEYINIPGSKRWLFPGFGPTPDKDQDDKRNHGSCVLSKVASPTFGVAKNVDVVIVKLQASTSGGGFSILSSTLADALIEVKKDIQDNKLQGKAVINFSFGLELQDSDRNKDWIKTMIQQIVDLDVPFTIASGNSAADGRPTVDRYPALWAGDINGLIVVGATDNDGNLAAFSQGGPLVSVWAPAVQIRCADNQMGVNQKKSGTSYAAPAVAGLAAYFMGLPGNGLGQPGSGQMAGNVKNLITTLAWPRKTGATEIVLWNNQNAGCSGTNKRDGSGGACSLSQASTVVSSTTATTATSGASPSAGTVTSSSPPSSTLAATKTTTTAALPSPPTLPPVRLPIIPPSPAVFLSRSSRRT